MLFTSLPLRLLRNSRLHRTNKLALGNGPHASGIVSQHPIVPPCNISIYGAQLLFPHTPAVVQLSYANVQKNNMMFKWCAHGVSVAKHYNMYPLQVCCGTEKWLGCRLLRCKSRVESRDAHSHPHHCNNSDECGAWQNHCWPNDA